MNIQMKTVRVTVFIILGGFSALMLGLIASARTLLGWALVLWGIGLLIESLGLSHHLVHPMAATEGMGTGMEKMTLAGILAVSIIPAWDFLMLPPVLPRTPAMQDAGMLLCALGLLVLLRSKISREVWGREDVLAPALRREINSGPDHANRFLEFSGVVLWAMGICLGFGSLAGIAALAFLILGIFPRRIRKA